MKKNLLKMKNRFLCATMASLVAVTSVPSIPLMVRAAGTPLLKAGSIPVTEEKVTQNQPFAKGTDGVNNFRIPALVSIENGKHRGTLVAATDARYGTTADGGGLDTMASISTDFGKTWQYSYPIYFPDSAGYAGNKATTAIDPGLIQDQDGTIYCLADMNPTGITTWFGAVNKGTGFVKIDGKDRLVLASDYANVNAADEVPTENNADKYPYYVGDFENGYARVYNRSDNTPTQWGVDEWYNIYHVDAAGNYTADLTQKQIINQNDDKNDVDVQQNVFYKDSCLHVYNTGYIWMVKSTDGGRTWIEPTILNTQIKRTTQAGEKAQKGEENKPDNALLVSPGKGTMTKDGTIMIPVYDHGDGEENASIIYSGDKGVTWKRTNDVQGGWTSESEIVELEDGTLRMFSRNGNGKICYADAVKDENDNYVMGQLVTLNISVTSTCNVSASLYSKKVDGKQAILMTCPTGSGRQNGKVFLFLVEDDKTMTLKSSYVNPTSTYGTSYAYSCLAELTDGSIGNLYENEAGNGKMVYVNYDFDDILNEAGEKQKTEIRLEYGTDMLLTVPQEETVSYDGDVIEINENLADGEELIYDASGTNGFSDTANTNLSLEDMEMTLETIEGNTNAFYVKSNTGLYMKNAAGMVLWGNAQTPIAFANGTEDGTFKVSQGSSYANNNRHVLFSLANNRFDANSNGNALANFTYDMLMLEKQGYLSDEDIIAGYKKVSTLTADKQYLMAVRMYDGSLAFMYPTTGGTDANSRKLSVTKKAEVKDMKNVVISGIKQGKATVVVGERNYQLTVDCFHRHITIDENAAGECTGTNYNGKVTCNACGEELTAHTWDAGVETLAPTAATDGEKTYTCQNCGNIRVERVDRTGTARPEATKAITTAPVADVTIPVEGEQPVAATLAGTATGYAVSSSSWVNKKTGATQETEFEAGSTYILKMTVKANDTYKFDAGAKAVTLKAGETTLEDVPVNVEMNSTDDIMTIRAEFKIPAPPEPIKYTITAAEIPSTTSDTSWGDAGGAAALFDGNTNTIWHTIYGTEAGYAAQGPVVDTANSTNNEKVLTDRNAVTFTLEQLSDVHTLRYLAKGNGAGANGNILEYEIQTAGEDKVFTTAATGSWTRTSDWCEAKFETVPDVKYVKLIAKKIFTNEINNAYISAREVEILGEKIVSCSCEVTDASLKATELVIPAKEENGSMELELNVTKNSTCEVPGHGTGSVTAEYTLVSEETTAAGAVINGTTLSVAGEGKVVITATVTWNQTTFTTEKMTVVVRKEQDQEKEEAKVSLNQAVKDLEELINGGQKNYDKTTWDALVSTYNKAKNALTTADASTLIALKAELEQAKANLKPAAPEEKPEPKPEPSPNPEEKPAPKPPVENPVQVPPVKGEKREAGNYIYKVTGTGTVEIVSFTAKAKKNTKAAKIYNNVTLGGKSFKVTSIAKNAFKGNKKLTTVVIGKNIQTIGANAFAGAKNLKKVTFKTKVLKKVNKGAFKLIHKKAVVKVPKAKKKAYTKLLKKGGVKASRIKA